MRADPTGGQDETEACEELEPLLAAYALGEPDPTMRARVDEHVRGCPACREALGTAHQTARWLPFAAPDAMPAPDLRERVRRAVIAGASGEESSRPAPRGFRSWPRGRRLERLVAATAILALLAWNVTLQRNAWNQAAAERERQAVLAELFVAPTVEEVSLPGGVPGARGVLRYVPESQACALTVEGLPPLPADRVYQLWLVAEGKRYSGGTFMVDPSGRGVLVWRLRRPFDLYESVGITVEPRGGSPRPTTPRVLGGPLG